MAVLKLQAPTKDYLWGGNRLVDEFGKRPAGDVTAESWELSCYPGCESVIENGEFAGKTLTDYINENGNKVLGKNCEKFKDFPILIKLIDARKDLSLQVPINAEDDKYPDLYAAFDGVEYVSDEPALAGEEDLKDTLNSDSELSINSGGDKKVQAIIEHASNGDMTFDQIMDSWNKAWTEAQELNGVDIDD